ncbi:MAG: class I SAM-dependent methyltransferase, partial [Bryobacteraceae bacterium]|nr:class I SAM-dependent methyltransferase [Bryobacteraceae bacterium]
VEDYTGLDLSPSVAKLYRKPFVIGSATKMPFADNSFDAIWTIWVLEHIPEPERALLEMRRVLRPGGVIFLYVAWNCTPWAADGFEVRPYSDFNWKGRLVKASIPVRASPLFQMTYRLPTRLVRGLQHSLGFSTSLRYRRLDPNYEVYWQPDSDGAVSLDSFEVYLWFRQKGDDCLNCNHIRSEWLTNRNPLIIQVNKAK